MTELFTSTILSRGRKLVLLAACQLLTIQQCQAQFQSVPELIGAGLRPGGQIPLTFRPVDTLPTPAVGSVVLDAAGNRFVYFDGANQLLVPGAGGIGPAFVTYRAPGGGVLTQSTNSQGITGFFGLERLTTDTGTGMTTVATGFDLLTQPGVETVTNTVTSTTYNAVPQSPRFSISSNAALNPSLSNAGLTRMATGGSPVVSDRVYFQHSFFDNTASLGGQSMNRFVPGIEQTFSDNAFSIEARFPFAATLDQDITVNGMTNTNEVVFGDITLALKAVLAQQDDWLISAGLQMTLPSADDLSYSVSDGTRRGEFLRIENDTVHLMPFLAGVYAPDDRFFAQGFLQLDFDTTGKPVLINPNALNARSFTEVGSLNDATFLYLDLNAGYWISRDSSSWLTGIAPIVELNYLTSLSKTDSVNALPLGTIGRESNVSTLLGTVGCVFEVENNTNVTVGYSTPFGGGSESPFDGQFQVMVSTRFGK